MIEITKWTPEEEQYLIKNSDKPLKEVAEKLGRNVQSIKDKRQLLGLKYQKIKNLKGKKFGRLLVIRENGRIGRRVAWLCRCDCGTEKTISSTHLIQKETVSCGCYNKEITSKINGYDLTRMKFNHLVAIKKIGKSNTYNTWLCLCDCGKYTEVSSTNLLSGNTESCGCRRNINQRKGMQWEVLVKKILKYKFSNFLYHKRLPNNSIPDFTVESLHIILDAKRHDYLKINECMDKYLPFCNKIIFICMEKKRTNWKKNFEGINTIEFWYPEDILNWIPHEQQNSFLIELKKIENLWIIEKDEKKVLQIDKTISELEDEGKEITQQTIAKKLGVSKKTLRKNSKIASYLQNYRKTKKEKEEMKMVENLKVVIGKKILSGQIIMIQDIARTLIKSQRGQKEEISEREVWALTKRLSTNPTYIKYIKNEQQRLKINRKKIVKKVVEELKIQNENITINKILLLSGLPKNYLYSEETKSYVKSLR